MKIDNESTINILNNILHLEKYTELNNEDTYMYLIEINKKLIANINEWNIETTVEIIGILNKIYNKIELVNYKKSVIKNMKANESNIINTMLIMIKDNAIQECIELVRLYNNNITNTQELKKYKTYLEKYEIFLSDKRMKINIIIDKIFLKFRGIEVFLLYNLTKPFFFFKDIWLIGERSDQAEDNGYVFFKYCRENEPSKKIYYIIEKDSKQAFKVEKLGNVIYRDTLKHKVYLLHATKLISAYHFLKFSTLTNTNKFKVYYMKYMKSNRIFLQHGVTMNKPYSLNRYVGKHDYIIIPTRKERNLFIEEYNYNKENILETGMARFDNLNDTSNKKNKTILFMPTWRSDLKNLSVKEFKQSEYFIAINSLLTNINLNKMLEKNNIKIIFYLHYEMQGFLDCFDTSRKNIIVNDSKNSIVQELLKSCNLLITDLSSVGCDFSFMEKPVIFYQFSKENFHYDINQDRRFNTYEDFGKVVDKEDDVITLLRQWIKNKYKNLYPIKKETYFYINDNDNCKRIFNAINKIEKKRKENYFEVPIKNENGKIIEIRYCDKNFNFIKRDYFRFDGSKRMTLFYKNTYIYKSYLYNENEVKFAMYKYHRNIVYDKKFYNIKKDGKLVSEYKQHKNGNLKFKIDYFNNGKVIKNKIHYYFDGGNRYKNEVYYSNGNLKQRIVYKENGKAKEAVFYTRDGVKERYYTYHINGKVKEKNFYNKKTRKLIEKLTLCEVDSTIIKTQRY